jgi:L-threonylcarbamoyladenylate synthase
MHPFSSPRGSEVLATLRRGGLVLLPTANLWQVVSAYPSQSALSRQLDLCPPGSTSRIELLFPDLEMVRTYFPRLHPKLETLLSFHRRPLTVLVEPYPTAPPELIGPDGRMAIRLIQDSFCYQIAEDLDQPLVATFARGLGSPFYPLSFGRVRSDVIKGVDYVVRRRQKDLIAEAPAVTIHLDERDEVVFVE